MFATCSDDHTIRIWEAPPTHPHPHRSTVHVGDTDRDHERIAKEKGKGREKWTGDRTDSAFGPTSSSL